VILGAVDGALVELVVGRIVVVLCLADVVVVAGRAVVVATEVVVDGASVVDDVVVTASAGMTTSFSGVVGLPAIAAPARAPTTTTSGIACQFRLIGP
jgi:hypothetical protein